MGTDNVRVVCLEPGYIASGLRLKGQELASDDAALVSRTSLLVDGAWVAHGGWRLDGPPPQGAE
jgi:hypothetical protein